MITRVKTQTLIMNVINWPSIIMCI